ncbi:MAG: hypothetical protein EXS64_08225 [Candidatus Latescibacteria bacterium]|nr:hypothetical protein [Candidatus Latescibacterota bacterium]
MQDRPGVKHKNERPVSPARRSMGPPPPPGAVRLLPWPGRGTPARASITSGRQSRAGRSRERRPEAGRPEV